MVARLKRAMISALKHPQFVDFFAGNGSEIVTSTTEEFASYIRMESTKWSKIVRDTRV